MIEVETNLFLVETLRDLEEMVSILAGKEVGFMDLETTSKNPKLTSLNPWHHCWIAGIAITTGLGDAPAFYIPVCHEKTLFSNSVNLPLGAVLEAVQKIAASWKLWVNQNVKYDMHVLKNETGWIPDCTVEDLATVAKIHDSDKFLYNLTVLAPEYAGVDIKPYEDSLSPYKVDNKDYGRIPVEVMAPYACTDVTTVRTCWNTLNRLLDSELDYIRIMERAVLSVLYETERAGLTVDPAEVKVNRICVGHELLMRSDRLAEEIDFPGFNVGSPKDMNEFFVNRLGLPVVKWTNEEDDDKISNPSFGKEAMVEYLVHPRAPTAIVKEVLEIRKLSKFHSAFLVPYDTLSIDGNVHSDYNQLIRTGRMSCKQPNAQQLNKVAKKLLRPKPGCSLLSIDQSQIEFRNIVHYIRDERCTKAYLENPDTDFHSWVSSIAHVSRSVSKTINFLLAFGGGKGKLIKALVKDPDLVAGLKHEADVMRTEGVPIDVVEAHFNKKSEELAVGLYETYMKAMPNLKRTSYAVADAARQQGYVRTLYKRRRHLKPERSHIAFNTACQGTAADYVKDSLVRLQPLCQSAGVDIVAIVHDSIVFNGPHDVVESEDFLIKVLEIMEKPEPLMPLRIPIRCAYGYSRNNWYEADNAQKVYPLEKSFWQRK